MAVSQKRQNIKKRARHASRWTAFWRAAVWGAIAALLLTYLAVPLILAALRWAHPPTTAVQMERRFDAWVSGTPYRKHYAFVPLRRISPSLQRAVIGAEDARFFEHHGFDWKEMETAVEHDLQGGKPRGASTITQQLDRNLFLSTNRSLLRKGAEFTLVPPTEYLLGKRRILELYLNLVEFGPGIYGCEAASRIYFRHPCANLTAEQAAELAALLPAPLHRHPGQPAWYVARIRARMNEVNLPW